MNRSLVALWITLFAAIATISVLAQFWIRQREQSSEQRVREILQSQLEPFNDSIGRVFEQYSIGLQRQLSACDLGDLQQCVELTRSPLADAVIVVNSQSQLVFPTGDQSASVDRQTLLDEAQQLLREQADPRPSARRQAASQKSAAGDSSQAQSVLRSQSYLGNSNLPQSVTVAETQSDEQLALEPLELLQAGESQAESLAGQERFGWITWYHRRGMVLAFWWHQGDQWKSMTVLPRARWMADIVAALPDGSAPGGLARKKALSSASTLTGSLKQLIDVEGNLIYQWSDVPQGQWSDVMQREPEAVLPVAAPLEGWRLRVYASDALRKSLAGDNMVLPLWLAVAGISAALVLGGVLVTTNLNRQFRLASRRVLFVNQVSHELRTPLTNICMYADLLAKSIESEHGTAGAAPTQLERASVIQNESRRLSRLIANVLQFARSESKPKQLQPTTNVLDDVVRDVLATFRPRLEELGFKIVVELATPEKRVFDPDAVEQVLVNLIGNAQKYAADGKYLELSTRARQEKVEILVQDHGPGVPARMAEKIFSPFVRGSDRLEDPAGTGIGLTIVRDLARRHGGDCSLVESPRGAAFLCTLNAPQAN